MRLLTSFKSFLQMGAFGDLSPDLALLQVANLLGPPSYWGPSNLATDKNVYPLFWAYEDAHNRLPRIEVLFDGEPPHRMIWFQIETAAYLEDVIHEFGRRLIVTLDGFTGSTRPSDYLTAGLWDLDQVRLHCSKYLDLRISVGRLSLHFGIDSNALDKNSEAEQLAFLQAFGSDRRFAEIDKLYELVSVYSHADPADATYAAPTY